MKRIPSSPLLRGWKVVQKGGYGQPTWFCHLNSPGYLLVWPHGEMEYRRE